MSAVASRLTDRLPATRKYPVGICDADISQIPLSPGLVEDIIAALESHDEADQSLGLMFCRVLIKPFETDSVQESRLVDLLLRLAKAQESTVSAEALRLLIPYRVQLYGFRDLMLDALRSPQPAVRRQALLAYEYFCLPKEVGPLEKLEHDDYMTEISMQGPLHYELRDLALEAIEGVLGKSFGSEVNIEATPSGQTVMARDWGAYKKWRRGNWLIDTFIR
jgi:hypothetical protein